MPERTFHSLRLGLVALAASAAILSPTFAAQAEDVLNVYTTRQEVLIQPVLDAYRAETGTQVNVIFAKEGLVERLKSEGANSLADVLITADVGYILDADSQGMLQAIDSDILNEAIPEAYRQSDGRWYGFSLRARPIMYAADRVDPSELSTYEDLADPKWKGRICIRSSSNVYNQSLISSMILANGAEATQEWANAFVSNFAREPDGGDRDQIKAVAAGECDIAIANTYYLGGMLQAEDEPDQIEAAKAVRIFWPNQDDRGVHVNITGGGVAANAPHREEAIRFLEFLVTDEAQRLFADVVNEYPVRADMEANDVVASFGEYEADSLPLEELAEVRQEAVQIMDRAGWK
ncbi:MAG: Fe(3+) ABC transporter substrate-binding protein [Rhodospirillaceae bacterium]|nr:Fe(3+) ABC transporter substrate-binding protein [Rhodospirillaceae bacterium]